MTTDLYQASRIKHKRATAGEMLERHAVLVAIVEEIQPCTVRQAIYQAEVRGVVPKTEAGVDAHGKVVVREAAAARTGAGVLAKLPPCVIGMEACGSAHYWARELMKLGHTVKLMAPQFVKPFAKSGKNDRNDAEGICEAVARPNMRFVAIKGVEHQDLQAVHRVRQRLIEERTALANQIRGLLAEYGIVIPKGISQVRLAVPLILEDPDNGLTGLGRELFANLYEQLAALDEHVAEYDKRINRIHGANALSQKLARVEGVGPLIATTFLGAVVDAKQFRNGRQCGAWLSLVPRQHSSGERGAAQHR